MTTKVKGTNNNVQNLVENFIAYLSIRKIDVADINVTYDETNTILTPLDEDGNYIDVSCPSLEETKDLKLITNDPLFEYLNLVFDSDIEISKKWGAYFSPSFFEYNSMAEYYDTLESISARCNYMRLLGYLTIHSKVDPDIDDEIWNEKELYDVIEEFSELWNYESIRENEDGKPLKFLVLKKKDMRLYMPFLPLYDGQSGGRLLAPGKILERNIPNVSQIYNDWFRERSIDILNGGLFKIKVDGSWRNLTKFHAPMLLAYGRWVYNELFDMTLDYRDIVINDDLTFTANLFSLEEYLEFYKEMEEMLAKYATLSYKLKGYSPEIITRMKEKFGDDVVVVYYDDYFWMVPITQNRNYGNDSEISNIINEYTKVYDDFGSMGYPVVERDVSFDGTISGSEVITRSGQTFIFEDSDWENKLTPFAIEYHYYHGTYPKNHILRFLN